MTLTNTCLRVINKKGVLKRKTKPQRKSQSENLKIQNAYKFVVRKKSYDT